MSATTPLVHVVDDDPEVRNSLQLLLSSVAIDTEIYASANEFLSRFRESPERQAALLLDVRMPGMSGMVLLERVRAQHPSLPIIIITGHGDIDMAVQAMKLGAMDFITKPFGAQDLLNRIQDVLWRAAESDISTIGVQEAVARRDSLTTREREVFDRIVAGDSNKAIAIDAEISIRTVESHRSNVMKKMKVKTLVDLVLLSVILKKAPERDAQDYTGR